MFNSKLVTSRSIVCQRLARFSHSIQQAPDSLIGSESPVLVYQAADHSEWKSCQGAGFDNKVLTGSVRGKFFSLMPFFMESHFSPKNYVL